MITILSVFAVYYLITRIAGFIWLRQNYDPCNKSHRWWVSLYVLSIWVPLYADCLVITELIDFGITGESS